MGLLLLARHGETKFNLQKIAQGMKIDSPLTAKGEADAEALREILRQFAPEEVYRSPSPRVITTAKIATAGLGIIPRGRAGLGEYVCEGYEGTSYAHLEDPLSYIYEHGAKDGTLKPAYDGAVAEKEFLVGRAGERNVAVIGHRVKHSLITIALESASLEYHPEFSLQNGRFHLYRVEGEQIIRVGLNLDKLVA